MASGTSASQDHFPATDNGYISAMTSTTDSDEAYYGDSENYFDSHEDVSDGTGEEDSRGPMDQICCLIDNGERCNKPAGNASYSKRIQKTVTQRRLNLGIDNSARHIYICDFHKMIIQCARTKRRRKDSEDDSNETDTDAPEVDLFQLQVNTLRRYKRHYKVSSKPSMNKAQLADTLMKHFKTIPVKEKEVVTFFIYTVKTNSNKLDQKNGVNNDAT